MRSLERLISVLRSVNQNVSGDQVWRNFQHAADVAEMSDPTPSHFHNAITCMNYILMVPSGEHYRDLARDVISHMTNEWKNGVAITGYSTGPEVDKLLKAEARIKELEDQLGSKILELRAANEWLEANGCKDVIAERDQTIKNLESELRPLPSLKQTLRDRDHKIAELEESLRKNSEAFITLLKENTRLNEKITAQNRALERKDGTIIAMETNVRNQAVTIIRMNKQIEDFREKRSAIKTILSVTED